MTDEEIFNRFYSGGYTYTELAAELGVSRSVIAGKIHRFKVKNKLAVPDKKRVRKVADKRLKANKPPVQEPKAVAAPEPKTQPYTPGPRLYNFTSTGTNKFFRRRDDGMTKNEMREVIRKAVENT